MFRLLAGVFTGGPGPSPLGPVRQADGPSQQELRAAIGEAATNAGLDPDTWMKKFDAYASQTHPIEQRPLTATEAAILTRADMTSERAMQGEVNFTENEYQIMYAAAEIRTGVPAEVLKATGQGESLASQRWTGLPSQFMNPGEAAGGALPNFCPALTTVQDGRTVDTWKFFIRQGEDGNIEVRLDKTPGDNARLVTEQGGGWKIYPLVHAFEDTNGNGQIDDIGFGIHAITIDDETLMSAFNDNTNVTWREMSLSARHLVMDPEYHIEAAANGLLQYAGSYHLDKDQRASWTPEQWSWLGAGMQGTLPNEVTQAYIVAAMTGDDPNVVLQRLIDGQENPSQKVLAFAGRLALPPFVTGEPDLLDTSVATPQPPPAGWDCEVPIWTGPSTADTSSATGAP